MSDTGTNYSEEVFEFCTRLKQEPSLRKKLSVLVETFGPGRIVSIAIEKGFKKTASVRTMHRLTKNESIPEPKTVATIWAAIPGLSERLENQPSAEGTAFRLKPEQLAYLRSGPHPASGSRYADLIIKGIEKLRADSRAAAESEARQSIMNILGALTERFGASSSKLFLLNCHDLAHTTPRPGELSLIFRHNADGVASTAKLGETDPANDLAGYVATEKRPYSQLKTPFFQLAVPILVNNEEKDEVIGVLCLDSGKANAFLESHVGELMAAATKLAPQIVIFQEQNLDPQAFGWHPEVHRWNPERLLNSFCAAVAGNLDGKHALKSTDPDYLPRPSCTIWYADHEHRTLHVRGTARFDYEYFDRRSLPLDRSFTGEVATTVHGLNVVGFGRPEKIGPFRSSIKTKNMGMVYAFAAPIFQSNPTDNDLPIGTVNLYFFEDELRELPGADIEQKIKTLEARFRLCFAADIARHAGQLIDGFQRLRIKVAKAYLRYRLHEQSLPGLTDFEIIKETLLECIDAHCCSLFVRTNQRSAQATVGHIQSGRLQCVATTGLQNASRSPVDQSSVYYDMQSDKGVTTSLAETSGKALRLRSVMINPHYGDPSSPRPLNKYFETYSLADTEHRPFLGTGVDDPANATSAPLGVIRVLRRSGSKPFTENDVGLIQGMAKTCFDIFKRWSYSDKADGIYRSAFIGARYPFLIRVADNSLTQPKLDAIARIGAQTLHGSIWNRRQVDAVLLDLVNVFRNSDWREEKQGGLIANFRIASKRPPSSIGGAENVSLRVYAIHSLLSPEPPLEDFLVRNETADKSVGKFTLDKKCAVTFGKESLLFRPILGESKFVESGACMPVRFVSRFGEAWGVLSLDCDDRNLDDWRSEHLEILALAAKKLDFLGRDNSPVFDTTQNFETWREALTVFLRDTLKSAGIAICNLRTLEDVSRMAAPTVSLGTSKNLSPRNLLALSSNEQGSLDHLLGDLGDRTKRQTILGAYWTTKGFKMNLWYGAFKTQLQLCGLFDTENQLSFQNANPAGIRRLFQSKTAEIIHLWNRCVSSWVGSGVKPLFRLTFKEEMKSANLERIWEPTLSLTPDIFGREPSPETVAASKATSG